MSAAIPGLIPVEGDPDSEAWWDAVARHELLLPCCPSCGRFHFPPLQTCPHCLSAGISLEPARGEGEIYSWIVIHRALDPAFSGEEPYTILAVSLPEGVRLWGRLIGDGTPEPGAAVSAAFYEVEGQTLLGFELDAPQP